MASTTNPLPSGIIWEISSSNGIAIGNAPISEVKDSLTSCDKKTSFYNTNEGGIDPRPGRRAKRAGFFVQETT